MIVIVVTGITNLILHLRLDRYAGGLIAYYNHLATRQNRKTLSPDYFSDRMFWRGLRRNVLSDFARRHRELSENAFVSTQEYARLRPLLLAVWFLEEIFPLLFLVLLVIYHLVLSFMKQAV